MTARVYSYIRFSDAKQAEGASSARQTAYAEKWAAENGLVLDAELSMRDEGLSAFHQRHVTKGALGVFLRAVEDGKVAPKSVLIVEGLDRLSRADPIDAQAQLTCIVNAGISVVTAEDGKVYSRANLKANPFDLIHSLLKMIRANEESETKSRRVRDALARQCRDWISGKSKGLVRFGNTPGWLRVRDGKWELIPERAKGVRKVIDLFCRGTGTGVIANELHAAGLSVSDSEPNSVQVQRLMTQPALYGEKRIELEGEIFVLENYYPPMIDRATFDEIQQLAKSRALPRGRTPASGAIPPVLTGTGVTYCGYCGCPMKSQTMSNKRRADGTLSDGHRRLQCARVNTGGGCAVDGSCSAGPIERALMRYCSDLVNLEVLYGGDRSSLLMSAVTAATMHLEKIEKQLDRLTEALMNTDSPVAAFTRKAQELQVERVAAQQQVKDAEKAARAVTVRADLTGADKRWRKLVKGVESLDYTSRMQARQLVTDTFERIEVYHHGVNPQDTPKGVIDLMLLAKGGVERMLRIDAAGTWVASEDTDAPRKGARGRKRLLAA
jgi:DNA invertase Pin-like site-specific DNA recombinase